MKNLQFFLLFSGLTALFSCSKSDEPTPQDLLIGKWSATSLIDLDGDQMVETLPGEYKTEVFFEFLEGGVAKIEIRDTDLDTGQSDSEQSNGTYVWEADGSLKLVFTSTEEPAGDSVLKGKPVLDAQSLSVNFSADTPDGDGILKLNAVRVE